MTDDQVGWPRDLVTQHKNALTLNALQRPLIVLLFQSCFWRPPQTRTYTGGIRAFKGILDMPQAL